MANFNFYLNRQGSIGRQGVKGDKGEAGYSPYIDIKSNTPTEFIMTIHNETESFDTPNLIPTAIGEKVTEMDAVLTTHTEDIANLKLEDQNINTNITSLQGDLTNLSGEVSTLSGEVASNSADITAIKNKNNAQDTDIAALKTRVGGTEGSIEDLNHKYTVLGSEVSDLSVKKQNRLVEGANITLTNNADGTTTISSTGGGGGGSSPLDNYIEGSTTENVTTISAKNGKALELSAPTIAVGDNLVNEINGANTQLYLKQGDIAAGNNVTVEKTATGVKISSTGGTSTDVPIATTEIAGKVKPDGTTITITEDGTISSVGGGSSEPPANMVTTDTTQTISGGKTFTSNLSAKAPIYASNGIAIKCTNNSPISQGLSISNEDMVGREFNISVNDAGQANISGTTLNIGDVSLTTYVSGRNINMTTGDTGNLVVNTNNPIKVHNKTANTDDIVLVQGNIKAGNNVSLTKDTTTGDITISSTGGGGSTPANMVTTDTDQFITGTKSFYKSINFKGSETDNYYSMITNTGGSLKLQAQYGNPAGLNVGSSSLTYTDANGIDHNLLESGGSSEPPANMVTTDTDQDITGIKTFKGNTGNNDPSIIFGGRRTGLDDVIGGKIKVNGRDSFEISTGAKGDLGLALRMTRNADGSPSYFDFTSNSSDIIPAIKLGKTNYQGTIKYDTSTSPFGFLFETESALSGYPYSSFKIADNTLTFKKTDGTVVDLLNNSSKEQYGIRADYALTHGIVSNPNGIISYNTTDKVITVHQGLVLSCAGSNNTAKTIISGDMQHTVTSTGSFTLFYANGELFECGQVDYSTEEPTNNGVTNYQAWFNPDKTVNTNQQWQFKSNDSGNVWRYIDNATPLADIVADSTTITSVSYLGYRVFNDDIFAHKSEWVYKTQVLINNVKAVPEDVTIDLSEYLPNDGYDYEIMFDVFSQPTTSTVSKFVHTKFQTNKMGQTIGVVQTRTTVANVDASGVGNCILPIDSTSRSVMMKGSTSSNLGGTRRIAAVAYRRINY